MATTQRPDDPREATLAYLRDRLEPGESAIVRAAHVRRATDATGSQAGRVLARLAGQTDGIGAGEGPADEFDVEDAWANSNAVRWRVRREGET